MVSIASPLFFVNRLNARLYVFDRERIEEPCRHVVGNQMNRTGIKNFVSNESNQN